MQQPLPRKEQIDTIFKAVRLELYELFEVSIDDIEKQERLKKHMKRIVQAQQRRTLKLLGLQETQP